MIGRSFLVSAALLLSATSAGCQGSPAAPDPSAQDVLADSLLLAPGQEVAVGLLRLFFEAVSSDSRCPVDAVCVWVGNAAVEVAVGLGEGPSHQRTLNTSEGTPFVDFNGFRVTLIELRPEPHAGVPIPAGDYRARFRVAALPDST